MSIDFYKFFGKYKNLDEKGIQLLNSFFNAPEITTLLQKIELQRQKRLKMFIGVLALVYILYAVVIPPRLAIEYFLISVFVSIFVIPVSFAVVKWLAKYLWGDDAKIELIPQFVKKIDPNMTYRKIPDSGIWNLDFLDAGVKNGILKPYHRIDKFEDTITYDILWTDGEKAITLRAVEIRTSVLKRSGKRSHRQVNNHSYLMKVYFPQPKMTIKKPISLRQDINENGVQKWITAIFGTAFFLFISLLILSPRRLWENGKSIVDIEAYIDSLTSTGVLVWIFVIFWIFVGCVYIFQYFANKKRVKMENIDFEKRFDVFCEDPEQTRQLLTPSFMYRILDYIDKIDPKRVYTFHFDQDHFFVKYDILASRKGNYMELSSMRKIADSLDDFVMFYLEVQGVKALISDLKLLYLDEKSLNTKIL